MTNEDLKAAAICLAIFAAIFLAAGIIPLVIYFGLKKGTNAVAEVTEHLIEETRTDRGQTSHTRMLKLKYIANGAEYERRYSVIKTPEYMDAHPVGTAIKIVVNPRDPKEFIMPEDLKKLLIPGIIFSVGGVGCLAGAINMIALLLSTGV